jgi:hypothetical protein
MVTITFNKTKEVKKVEAAKPVVKAVAKVEAKKPSELQRINVLERKVAALESKAAKACAKKK